MSLTEPKLGKLQAQPEKNPTAATTEGPNLGILSVKHRQGKQTPADFLTFLWTAS
jgi:hypothetical protein